jgi:hypothetical protein
MKITNLTITEDQLFALASAVDIALDDIYHTHANGDDQYCADTAKQLEGLQAILSERILSVTSK